MCGLTQVAGAGTPHTSRPARQVCGPSSTVLAWVDDELRGTAMVGVDGHHGWMYYLAVDPVAQGNGIGRQLVAAAEEWVRERGTPKLMLMVRSDNAAVIGFYEAPGYDVNQVATLGRRL
ncbi:MAG: putative GNAT-family acetyltransferase [Frankiales bacterium]|nr:putative GNAT-family acetyltransferase [Frankiales bacterium]